MSGQPRTKKKRGKYHHPRSRFKHTKHVGDEKKQNFVFSFYYQCIKMKRVFFVLGLSYSGCTFFESYKHKLFRRNRVFAVREQQTTFSKKPSLNAESPWLKACSSIDWNTMFSQNSAWDMHITISPKTSDKVELSYRQSIRPLLVLVNVRVFGCCCHRAATLRMSIRFAERRFLWNEAFNLALD